MPTCTNPLWATHFADAAEAIAATICENRPIARETYQIRLECPEIARRIGPGQFVMLRLPGRDDPLLARPFALYDTVTGSDGQPVGIDVVYLVVGAMTGRLAKCVAGESIEVIGPLGNGFLEFHVEHLIMVAGGIGQTPFLALAKEQLGSGRYGWLDRITAGTDRCIGNGASADDDGEPFRQPTVTLCYGAKSSEYLAGVADFEAVGVDIHISTDDGSAGHHGFVTELLEKVLAGSSDSFTGLAQRADGSGSHLTDHRSHYAPRDEAAHRSHHAARDETLHAECKSTGWPPHTECEGYIGPHHAERDGYFKDNCLIVACGPEPMMEAVAGIAAKNDLPCQVSLESPMACGMGICFSCVAKVRQPDGGWDYKRTCVDGPVFDAKKIVW